MLYTSPLASVRINNTLSSYFQRQRGTRQGCPLSLLLFALVMEPLAISIWYCTDINGIFRGSQEYKISLYADDVLPYVSDPLSSIPHILNMLEEFGRFSGYKLNLDKSELLPISPAARLLSLHSLPFKVTHNQLSYLGISNNKILLSTVEGQLYSTLRLYPTRSYSLVQYAPITGWTNQYS